MRFQIKYVPLNPTAEGGIEGPYSGRVANADFTAEAVVAFSEAMNDIYPNRTVAVNANAVALREDDIRLIKEGGVEYRKEVEAPFIEIFAVENAR